MNKIQPTMLQLNSPTGSGYEEEWAIKLPAGLTFHSIELETNLKNVATIEKVTIDIGGTPVCYSSNVNMDLLDKLLGKFQETGTFVFDLSKFEYRSLSGVFQTQLTTGIRDDVTLLIQMGKKATAAPADPTTPTLKAKAWVTDSPNATARFGGGIFRPTKYELTQYAAAAGVHEWDIPNGANYKHIQRMIFRENEVAISKLILKRGSRILHTVTRKDLDRANQRIGELSLQAGYCVLDFTILGWGSYGAMETDGLSIEFTVDGAGAIKTYIEGYDQVLFPQKPAV